ncbi:MAG: group II intron reverse transcriptase/maturase [Bacteroidota bacterium]
MRKKQGHQIKGKQLSLFPAQRVNLRPSLKASGTVPSRQRESSYFSLLARNRAFTETLLEAVMSVQNLNRAYETVKRNGGASGVDQMDIKSLKDWLGLNGQSLITKVLSEAYQPSEVLGVEIPKPNGGVRLLGIPTVLDRLIQQAIHQQLMVLYEPLCSEHSYGFRPGHSALQAIEQASKYISRGYHWVVDIDLKSFFDWINQDRLMQRLHKGIGDKRLLRLIRKYLQAGMLLGGMSQQRTSGTPQGGPLSPLLSNIVLDELDKELEKRGHAFVRYADDCNIYVKSQAAGERVLDSISKFIAQKLKLKVNEEKSGVRRCEAVKFLGYKIQPDGGIRVADKSKKRFKDKVRQVTKRNRGVSFSKVIEDLNAIHRGWVGYFKLANCWLPWRSLDGWIRRRLRTYRLKQCGRRYTIFKFLRSLGANPRASWNAIFYAGGWYKLSAKIVCQRTMNKGWFDQNGLHSLTDLYTRKRFTC